MELKALTALALLQVRGVNEPGSAFHEHLRGTHGVLGGCPQCAVCQAVSLLGYLPVLVVKFGHGTPPSAYFPPAFT